MESPNDVELRGYADSKLMFLEIVENLTKASSTIKDLHKKLLTHNSSLELFIKKSLQVQENLKKFAASKP